MAVIRGALGAINDGDCDKRVVVVFDETRREAYLSAVSHGFDEKIHPDNLGAVERIALELFPRYFLENG